MFIVDAGLSHDFKLTILQKMTSRKEVFNLFHKRALCNASTSTSAKDNNLVGIANEKECFQMV